MVALSNANRAKKKGPTVTFISVLPIQNRSGTLRSPTVAWPQGAQEVDVRLDVSPFAGLANPFSDPALHIEIGVDLSLDGGVTWQSYGSAGFFGKPFWATNVPMFGCRPQPDAMPTHGRAWYTVGAGQTVTFGASVQVK